MEAAEAGGVVGGGRLLDTGKQLGGAHGGGLDQGLQAVDVALSQPGDSLFLLCLHGFGCSPLRLRLDVSLCELVGAPIAITCGGGILFY